MVRFKIRLLNPILILVLILILLNTVFASDMQPIKMNQGIFFQIEAPETDIIKIGTNYSFTWHVFTSTGGLLSNDTINCIFELYDSQSGEIILEDDNPPMNVNFIDFEVNINDSFVTHEGNYYKSIICYDLQLNSGYFAHNFKVGYNTEESTVQESIFYTALLSFLFILALLSIMLIFFINPKDNYTLLRDNKYQLEFNYGYHLRMFFITLGYILFWIFFFILWELSKKFFLSNIMGNVIYYIFFILSIGILPLLIIIFSLSIIKIFSDLDLNRRMQGGFRPFP